MPIRPSVLPVTDLHFTAIAKRSCPNAMVINMKCIPETRRAIKPIIAAAMADIKTADRNSTTKPSIPNVVIRMPKVYPPTPK